MGKLSTQRIKTIGLSSPISQINCTDTHVHTQINKGYTVLCQWVSKLVILFWTTCLFLHCLYFLLTIIATYLFYTFTICDFFTHSYILRNTSDLFTTKTNNLSPSFLPEAVHSPHQLHFQRPPPFIFHLISLNFEKTRPAPLPHDVVTPPSDLTPGPVTSLYITDHLHLHLLIAFPVTVMVHSDLTKNIQIWLEKMTFTSDHISLLAAFELWPEKNKCQRRIFEVRCCSGIPHQSNANSPLLSIIIVGFLNVYYHFFDNKSCAYNFLATYIVFRGSPSRSFCYCHSFRDEIFVILIFVKNLLM